MRYTLLFTICFLAHNLSLAGVTEVVKLTTPRGTEIYATAYYPNAQQPMPIVIIAPGKNYHMDLALIQGLSEFIGQYNYATIRFNWSFYSEGHLPSIDLKDELEDLQTVYAFLKTKRKVNKDRIIIAGKSLGSIVAHDFFVEEKKLHALLLMTPICTSHWDKNGNNQSTPRPVAKQYYPELLKQTRPIVVSLGNRDAYCSLPMLYDFLKDSQGNISTLTFEGDHGLNVGPIDDARYSEINAMNVHAANALMAYWIDTLFKVY